MFSGEEGHLVPLYGVGATSQGCFEIAGKLLAHSMLHSCDGLVGLTPAVVEYFVTGSVENLITVLNTNFEKFAGHIVYDIVQEMHLPHNHAAQIQHPNNENIPSCLQWYAAAVHYFRYLAKKY